MRRLPFIDSLRGIAAIYVVLYHMVLLPSPNLLVPHWAYATVLTGGTAVTLFFIVSAFSLCHTMTGHLRDGAGAFYIRRLFRIAPLFYAMIVYYVIRNRYLYGIVHSPSEIADNVAFVFNFIPGWQDGIVAASWTIGVEMLFYLVFPLVYAYSKTYEQIAAMFLASLCIGVVGQEVLFYTNLSDAAQTSFLAMSILKHAPIFIIGIGVYAIFDRQVSDRSIPAALGVTLILGSLYLYHTLLRGGLTQFFSNPYYWQGLIYGCLVIGLAIYPSAIFVNRATLYCGRLSYSIYLAHPAIITPLAPVYRAIYRLPIPLTLQFLGAALLTLSLVIAVATVLYKFIERPGMRLGQRVLLLHTQRGAIKPLPG